MRRNAASSPLSNAVVPYVSSRRTSPPRSAPASPAPCRSRCRACLITAAPAAYGKPSMPQTARDLREVWLAQLCIVLIVSPQYAITRVSLGGEMESREDCLHEATECDRLADIAKTQATRALLTVAAFQWRKLAEKAAERQKTQWPFASEAIRPN